MSEYEPELGQALFGQPYKEHGASELLIAAIREIGRELDRVMWNKHQKVYSSPLDNTGNSFKCDVFEIEAYSWNEDYAQPYNFKWRDVEVSWYKYLGRGTTVNQKIKGDKISKMLDECLSEIREMDVEL